MGEADGERLADSAALWRRVPPEEQLPRETADGPVVPKGSAFRTKGTEDGTSVGIAAAFEAAGKGPEDLLALAPGADDTWGVLETTAGEVRALGGLDVVADAGDPLHALIKPPPSGGKSRKISKSARWVIEPPGP